jgi:hypothetical protein
MNWLELILYGVMLSLIGILLVVAIRLKLRNYNLFVDLVQSETNLTVILSKLEDVEKQRELEKSEGFIRFISESRDWAFDYIEEAQLIVKDFLAKSDGMFKGADINPDLLISYRKLKALLPDEDEKS